MKCIKQASIEQRTSAAPAHLQEGTHTMTGYQVAKAVNELLTLRGLKAIPPQMVYNYMKKGMIKSDRKSVV